jgi:hypothetical protein
LINFGKLVENTIIVKLLQNLPIIIVGFPAPGFFGRLNPTLSILAKEFVG